MNLVADTGPLIALAKVAQLPLLNELFQQGQIPPMVHRELLAKVGPEASRLDAALADFIHVSEAFALPAAVELVTERIDAGERDAIALAYKTGAFLLMDDRLGRQAAQQLQIPVSGTAGLLLQAKRATRIEEVLPILQEMQERGYWLSDALLRVAAKLAGEAEL